MAGRHRWQNLCPPQTGPPQTGPPQTGPEQAGRRPALILSPKHYNQRIGLALACPITSRIKGYPFEVVIMGIAGLQGAVLADHVRSVDWRARRVDLIGQAPDVLVGEVLARLRPLLMA